MSRKKSVSREGLETKREYLGRKMSLSVKQDRGAGVQGAGSGCDRRWVKQGQLEPDCGGTTDP